MTAEMEEQLEQSEEIKRLRRCVNDLVSVLALPALWSSGEPLQLANTLGDALLAMLNLDLVFVKLNESPGRASVELVRIASWREPASQLNELANEIAQSLLNMPQKQRSVIRKPFGAQEMSIVPLPLGLGGETGMVAACSRRAEFPTQAENLVLSVAADQALIGVQQARLLCEQKRMTAELDERVAQRTRELGESNQELRRQIDKYGEVEKRLRDETSELRRSENALRETHAQMARSEERWRSVFENSAVGVALADPSGRFLAVNPVYQRMLGYTEEELQSLTFLDVTLEDEVEASRKLVGELIAGERGEFQIEKQYRRKDGSLVWARSHVSFVPGTDRVPRFLMAIVEDIADRKRAEEALQAKEHDLHMIINTIPALAWSAGPDGFVDFFNQRWLDYAGLSADQARGSGWLVAVHPDDLNRLMDYWRAIKASGQAAEIEARFRRFDGEYRWFLTRASVLRDSSGKIVRWYGFNTDIDDRRRAEEQVRRSEAFLAETQYLAGIGSFCWRTETSDIKWSEQLYHIFDFEPGVPVTLDLIGTRVHPEDLARMQEMVEKAQRAVSDFDYEHRLLMPDGVVKHVHLIAHATRDYEGKLEYIGAVQDVTQRQFAEEALAAARAELAQMTRVTSLGALTASIAHEVNQPLAGIVTNAGTCLRFLNADPPNIEGARETARRTIRDGNRASDVITRLRTLFSKKEVAAEDFDLNEAAREVIALSMSDLQRNRIVLRHELADELPPVKGDRVQLQQVILNLLRNASDAMTAIDDRPRELFVRTEREARNRVRFSVKDAGVGFDPQLADRLFEGFYTTKLDGMGMGLSVSRSIIEAHQGRLSATLNDGPGATFAFSIPREPEAPMGPPD